MTSPTDTDHRHSIAGRTGLIAAAMGAFVLVGWVLDIAWIKSVIPGAVTMKVNTAVGLLLSGIALWLLEKSPPKGQRAGQALAITTALIGALTLGEYILGWNLGIDELLFRDTSTAYNPYPGRMSPFSAVVFAGLGVGLAVLPARPLRWVVWLSANLSIVIGSVSLIGYAWNADELVTDRIIPPVALHTSVAFVLLGVGTFVAAARRSGYRWRKLESLSPVETSTLAAFAVTILLLLLIGGHSYRTVVEAARAARWVAHTQEVRSTLDELYGAIFDAESQQRSYILTGNQEYLDECRIHSLRAGAVAEKLAGLVADNSSQAGRVESLRQLIAQRVELLQSTAETFERSGLAAAQATISKGTGREIMANIRASVAKMGAVEAALLRSRSTDAAAKQSGTLFSLLATLVVATAGFMVLYRGIRWELEARTKAEEALRRSEEDLAVTLHSIGDAVLATDIKGIVTRLNPIAEKLTGWTQAEARGRPIADVFRIINEETRQPAVIPVDKVLATGEIHGLANHTVIIARDGTEVPIADSAAPIHDKEGGIVGVVLVFRDVTGEKEAERLVRESELKYRTLFNSIDEGFCIIEMIFDNDGKPIDYRFLQINPSFERQTGLRDALGKRMRELAPEHESHWFEIYGRIAKTGKAERFQNHARQLQRWFDVYAFRMGNPEDRLVAILFSDITKRKEAEAEILRFNTGLEELVAQRTSEMREALLTLDATEDGAFIFDPQTLRHTYVNEGAIQQLGYSRDQLLKMTPWDIRMDRDEEKVREMLAPLLRGETAAQRVTTTYRRVDGTGIPVEINLQYVAPSGERPRFIAIVRDITERLKSERQALRSQRLESIGTLAGGIAHDLNNALAPIMMSTEFLRMQYPTETQALDMIQTSAKRGADMVRHLLTFAKGAEGERVSLQFGTLVNEMANLIKGSFPKNIQFVVQCSGELPPIVGDATQLHQVLLNLCVNARDAMPDGGTLTLEAELRDVDAVYASTVPDCRPGRYVVVCVRDTGAGIPPEIIDRIFDPFFTTKSPDRGTGLGLSTVMGIVKGHGGFLQVYSQPGKGSNFTVYLPAQRGTRDGDPTIKIVSDFRGNGETILLVDDEVAIREMGRTVLRHLNFKPLTAIDGTDALIQASQNRTEIRVIITDLHMPRMDGIEFIAAVRKMLPNIPIVLASGRMDESVAEQIKALAVSRRLDKPFTEAQLVEVLQSVLAKA